MKRLIILLLMCIIVLNGCQQPVSKAAEPAMSIELTETAKQEATSLYAEAEKDGKILRIELICGG